MSPTDGREVAPLKHIVVEERRTTLPEMKDEVMGKDTGRTLGGSRRTLYILCEQLGLSSPYLFLCVPVN